MDKKKILPIVVVIIVVIVVIVGVSSVLSDINNPSGTNNQTDDKGYWSTAILTAKDVQIDKNTFSNPVNRDDLFEVRLVKHDLKQLEFSKIKKETYDNYMNYNNDYINNIVKKEQKTINGTAGYLLTIKNEHDNIETFSFIFERNGEYYEIASEDGDITWNSDVEHDLSLLLTAWLSKLPNSDNTSTTQNTATTNNKANDGRPTESEYYDIAKQKGDDSPIPYEDAMENWRPGSVG